MPRAKRSRTRVSVAPRDLELSYEELRAKWRRSLDDGLVRSMASDYLRGFQDECNYDAYLEYQRRFGSLSSRTLKEKARERRTRR